MVGIVNISSCFMNNGNSMKDMVLFPARRIVGCVLYRLLKIQAGSFIRFRDIASVSLESVISGQNSFKVPDRHSLR